MGVIRIKKGNVPGCFLLCLVTAACSRAAGALGFGAADPSAPLCTLVEEGAGAFAAPGDPYKCPLCNHRGSLEVQKGALFVTRSPAHSPVSGTALSCHSPETQPDVKPERGSAHPEAWDLPTQSPASMGLGAVWTFPVNAFSPLIRTSAQYWC